MSELGDTFSEWKRQRQALKRECPGCREVRPKASPSMLMPGQRCRACGHRDTRDKEKTT